MSSDQDFMFCFDICIVKLCQNVDVTNNSNCKVNEIYFVVCTVLEFQNKINLLPNDGKLFIN